MSFDTPPGTAQAPRPIPVDKPDQPLFFILETPAEATWNGSPGYNGAAVQHLGAFTDISSALTAAENMAMGDPSKQYFIVQALSVTRYKSPVTIPVAQT